MHILIRAAVLLAAGAAGWALAKRKPKEESESGDPRVVYLSDEDCVIDGSLADDGTVKVPATVQQCFRRMDPITLKGASDVAFLLEDGRKVKLLIPGESGRCLNAGDTGLLTWQGTHFILFEKDSGELIGSMFHAPAEEAANE